MNYEKKYKDALERAKEKYAMFEGMKQGDVLEDVFPELKESGDGSIRKAIHIYLDWLDGRKGYEPKGEYSIRDMIAWLEKQGEHQKFVDSIQIGDKVTRNKDGVLVNLSQLNRVAKKDEKQGEQKPTFKMKTPEESLGIDSETYNKIVDECVCGEQKPAETKNGAKGNDREIPFSEQKPTDNIEPKFKVGDFIVNDYCIGKVIELTNDAYLLDTGQGIPFSCEHNAHLWTIQDAKNGDVLATLDYILIFKEFLKNDGGISYCHYDFGAGNPQFIWSEDKNWYFGKEAIVYPATKEQRDLLFSKMKEAGYEWDADKKELKKIKYNSAWSEEDETILKILNELVDTTPSKDFFGSTKEKCIFWLKSLKDRVQPKQEWSEEDEEMYKEVLTDIIYAKNDLKVKECLGLSKRAMKAFNWFSKRYKSLKPQSRYKPSDEQIGVIEAVINNRSFQRRHLDSLYEQLKKLKEE